MFTNKMLALISFILFIVMLLLGAVNYNLQDISVSFNRGDDCTAYGHIYFDYSHEEGLMNTDPMYNIMQQDCKWYVSKGFQG